MPHPSLALRVLLVIGLAALIFEGTAARHLDAQPKGLEWYDLWYRGIETTDCNQRIRYIEAALEKEASPILRADTRRGETLDGYFPYLKLAEAYSFCGNSWAAKDFLKRSLAHRSLLETEIAAARNDGKRRKARQLTKILNDWQKQRVELASKLAETPNQVAEKPERPPEERAPGPVADTVIAHIPSSDEVELPSEKSPENSSRNGTDSPSRTAKPKPQPERNWPSAGTEEHSSSSGNNSTTATVEPSPPDEGAENTDLEGTESETEGIQPPLPTPDPPPIILPILTIGDTLSITCSSCQYREAEGVLVIGSSRVRLPRGYETVVFKGETKPFPVDHTSNYDRDLEAFEELVRLRESSLLGLPLPEAEASPPTAWMVGTILFWPRARPPHFYEQASRRFDEIVALKTIQYRSRVAELMVRLQTVN